MRALKITALLITALLLQAQSLGTVSDDSIGLGAGEGGLGGAGNVPLFDLNINSIGNGPTRLDDALSVNGTALTLVIACHESQVSGTDMACTGATLSERGSNASPVQDERMVWTDGTRGVRAGGTSAVKDYGAANNTFGDVTTHDMAIEYIGKWSAGYAISKRAGSPFTGWAMVDIGGMPNCVFDDGPTQINVSGGQVSTDAFVHVICFYDANEAGNGSVAYVNTVQATPVATNGMGSMTNSATLQVLGNDHISSTVYQATPLSSVRVWRCPDGTPNCFAGSGTNLTQWQTIAMDRGSRVLGVKPLRAGSPATIGTLRATFKTCPLDQDSDGVERLYTVGNNAPCIARVKAANGTYGTGFLSEVLGTNKALRSAEFNDATWTKTQMTVSTDARMSAALSTTADGLIGSNVGGAHQASQSITLTAAAHTVQIWAEPGTGAGNKAILINDNIQAIGACFKLADCTFIATYAGSSVTRQKARSVGGGRCHFQYTWTATAVATAMRVFTSDDDNSCAANDENYTGDGATVDAYVWGFQVEASAAATSYIPTAGSQGTRNRDDFLYAASGNTNTELGTLVATMLVPDVFFASTRLAAVGDGTNNVIFLEGVNATNSGFSYSTGAGTQASPNGATAYLDGNIHVHRALFMTNNVRYFFDGTQVGATDVSATMIPQGTATRFGIGNNSANTPGGQPNGLILRVQAFNKLVQ